MHFTACIFHVKTRADDYAFFSKLILAIKSLNDYRKEFLDHMGNGLHGDFDRGYFSAWADCMRILSRMDIPAPKGMARRLKKKKSRHSRSDKSQATIANFLKKTRKKKKIE